MSLSKSSGNRAAAKHSGAAKGEAGAGQVYGTTVTIPYNSKSWKFGDVSMLG